MENTTVVSTDTKVMGTRLMFLSRMLGILINDFVEDVKDSPYNKNVLRDAASANSRLVREIVVGNNKGTKGIYLDVIPDEELIYNTSLLVDIMARFRHEESPKLYHEFCEMVTDTFDQVFWAHSNRRKMHFPKYRAILRLLVDELKADIAKYPGRFVFTNNRVLMINLNHTPMQEVING